MRNAEECPLFLTAAPSVDDTYVPRPREEAETELQMLFLLRFEVVPRSSR